ncbi:GtrA family protein [Halegenticoccus soli]|uniref:GtrA family protein n=1 Tax=Halegenticoccus soli TaxID=1985678 RepID=UPI001E49CF25|nr:GtrA family protein [Halegenticoccus soli]
MIPSFDSRVRRLASRAEAGRLARFFVVGSTAALVQTALLAAFVEVVGLYYLVAAVVAIEITIVLQYFANNAWTFGASRHRTAAEYAGGLLRTNLVRGTAIPIQVGLLYLFVNGAPVGYALANLGAIFVSGFYRYLLDSRWTW